MEDKQIEYRLKQQKNYVIVAFTLGFQGAILLLTGFVFGFLNTAFHFNLSTRFVLIMTIAFLLSGLVDMGIALYFYTKSRRFAD